MMPEEKDQLLALLDHEDRWCREAEAQDADGEGVRFDDEAAVAWDITGALCRLFGWPRACVLFGQFDRHIHGRRTAWSWPPRDPELDAMAALQDFNDRAETTFAVMREQIGTMPVWHGGLRTTGAVGES